MFREWLSFVKGYQSVACQHPCYGRSSSGFASPHVLPHHMFMHLQDLSSTTVLVQQLLQRNHAHPNPEGCIPLPFVLIQCGKDALPAFSISDERQSCVLTFPRCSNQLFSSMSIVCEIHVHVPVQSTIRIVAHSCAYRRV
jgi:hypothetical protein